MGGTEADYLAAKEAAELAEDEDGADKAAAPGKRKREHTTRLYDHTYVAIYAEVEELVNSMAVLPENLKAVRAQHLFAVTEIADRYGCEPKFVERRILMLINEKRTLKAEKKERTVKERKNADAYARLLGF
jgi:hypothetical protein